MTGPVTTEASPFAPKPGLSALGGAEWLEAIAAKFEAGGKGIGPNDHMAASLRQTAGEVRAVVAAHQQVTAERDRYRDGEEISDVMAQVGFDRMMEVCKERDAATSELARLRAEGEAKDRALKEATDKLEAVCSAISVAAEWERAAERSAQREDECLRRNPLIRRAVEAARAAKEASDA